MQNAPREFDGSHCRDRKFGAASGNATAFSITPHTWGESYNWLNENSVLRLSGMVLLSRRPALGERHMLPGASCEESGLLPLKFSRLGGKLASHLPSFLLVSILGVEVRISSVFTVLKMGWSSGVTGPLHEDGVLGD